jgi:hypothetical protein
MLVSMGRLALLAVAAATLVLAGCGGSGTKSNGEATKPAAQVVADAQSAATGATIVHVSGAGKDNGQPLQLDLWIGNAKAKGRLVENGAGFQLIRVGDVIYIKGSDAFLKRFAGAAAATLFHGRWLKGSVTKGELAALGPLTDLKTFFKGILGQHGKIANKGETDYKGQKAVEIRDSTQGGSLYVASSGTPYPVALAGGKQQGDITFANWNADVTVAAPKNAVDLSKLP